ncbi:MAG: DUF2167 domain-containing protein [Rhodospirillaceae bacterium]|nr:DUF2167 domain-containing protein [Rhodospirillaceae bacterium]
MKRLVLALIVVFMTGATAFAQEGPDLEQMTEQQRTDELNAMKWAYEPGTYELPLSHSTIELQKGQQIILGDTAARYDYLTGGLRSPETEAIVWNEADESMTYFAFHAIGYVTEEDWERVDAAEFLKQMQDAQLQENTERERVGIDPFYLSGWRQEPTFVPGEHTAYWATELTNIMDRWVNASALRLSRDGYHQIIWAGAGTEMTAAQSTLASVLATHRYDEGHRYEDFADGDDEAGMSVGELAAATMGVDFSTGALAAILGTVFLFLKKGGVILVAIGAGVAALVGRKKRKAASPPPPTSSTQPPPPSPSQPPPPAP